MRKNSKPPEERRRELVTVASRLFSEKGYEAVSVRDILDAVHGALGMFYYYFKSKQDIYLATIEKYLSERIERRCQVLEDANVSFDEKQTAFHQLLQEDIAGYYNVLHVDQCDGIEPKHKEPVFTPLNPVEEAERVLADYSTRCGVPIIHEKGNRAYYRPSTDEIHLPLMEQFSKQAEYYSVAFHESVHSTGHKSRLNRLDDNSRFGNEVYSKEELVAEMGAATILHELGIETDSSFHNSAAYIQNWLHVLKDDPKMVVLAAGKAEKAVKLILNVEQAEQNDEGHVAEQAA